MVPEGAQAAGSRREGRAAGRGPKSGPYRVILEATGLAAGTEVINRKWPQASCWSLFST